MTGRFAFFRVALALGFSFAASAHLRTISEGTARKLVQEALVALGQNGPSVQIGPWKYYWAPEFYTFSAWRHNLAYGLVETYDFAVNPWTGDVWDATACKRITSPAIEKEQKLIWKRFQLSAETRRVLRDKSPACSAVERKVNPELK